MKVSEKTAQRLALLEGASFSPADLEAIVDEIADIERIVAELEQFSHGDPWVAAPIQPAGRKV